MKLDPTVVRVIFGADVGKLGNSFRDRSEKSEKILSFFDEKGSK